MTQLEAALELANAYEHNEEQTQYTTAVVVLANALREQVMALEAERFRLLAEIHRLNTL